MASSAAAPADISAPSQSPAAPSTAAGAAIPVATEDARYTFDSDRLATLKSQSPWSKGPNPDPKYFTSAAFSPSSIMKMLMHCHSGVEKGLKKGGNPIEVMGLMLGRPDPDTPRTLVVTDVFPLPIEGFETRVIADDADVVNHMIALGESLERTRKEKFMGWYHSHPFDVSINSHCFLSQTDLSTQLQWQRAEDPHGNPFLAVVIDPLRSLAKNVPELKAFRAYPPEYNSPIPNECPDGSVEPNEQARLERWGSCWSRYYELSVEYYMSGSARNVMGVLTQNFLWMRTLGSTPMLEDENRGRFPDRVGTAADKILALDLVKRGGAAGGVGGASGFGGGGPSMGGPAAVQARGGMGVIAAGPSSSSSSAQGGGGGSAGGGGGVGSAGGAGGGAAAAAPSLSGTSVSMASAGGKDDDGGELGKACQAVVELATEKLHGNIGQVAKRGIFS